MAFSHYSLYTVAGGQVPSAQTNFPMVVYPTETWFKTTANGGLITNTNGYDIRPYSNALLSTPLTYQLVPGTYSPTTGTFQMRVLVASLDVGSQIYFAIGNTSITTDGSSTAVWDSNYKGVWACPNGASLSLADSTGNANDGTGVSSPTAAIGQVDGGVETDGTSYVSVPDQSYWDPAGDFTISGWFKYDDLAGQWYEHSFIAHDPTGDTNKWIWARVADGSSTFRWHINTPGASIELNSATTTTSPGTWYHQGLKRSGNDYTFYLNGATNGTASNSKAIAANAAALFISNGEGAAGNRFDGVQDEIKFSDGIARPTNWFTTEYNNEKPATFGAFSSPVEVSGQAARWVLSRGGIFTLRTSGGAGLGGF